MRATSPPEDVHALDLSGLLDATVTFVTLRRDGLLLGVGALRHLNAEEVEVKSMHTAQAARGQGVGRALLEHLIGLARGRGYRRMSLETGTQEAFTPAHALYTGAGFGPCAPFGDHVESPHSRFLSLELI